MLLINVPLTREGWDEKLEQFVPAKEYPLRLEHSLVSLSKWESRWCKPFLSKAPMTDEETIDYIKCMTLTQNVPEYVYDHLTRSNIKEIEKYISAPMTATTVREPKNARQSREIVTAEIIYHWMISLEIPFECQKWHLNKLLMLIKVRNIKLNPGKKMSRTETMKHNAALNAARKKQLNTRG